MSRQLQISNQIVQARYAIDELDVEIYKQHEKQFIIDQLMRELDYSSSMESSIQENTHNIDIEDSKKQRKIIQEMNIKQSTNKRKQEEEINISIESSQISFQIEKIKMYIKNKHLFYHDQNNLSQKHSGNVYKPILYQDQPSGQGPQLNVNKKKQHENRNYLKNKPVLLNLEILPEIDPQIFNQSITNLKTNIQINHLHDLQLKNQQIIKKNQQRRIQKIQDQYQERTKIKNQIIKERLIQQDLKKKNQKQIKKRKNIFQIPNENVTLFETIKFTQNCIKDTERQNVMDRINTLISSLNFQHQTMIKNDCIFQAKHISKNNIHDMIQTNKIQNISKYLSKNISKLNKTAGKIRKLAQKYQLQR